MSKLAPELSIIKWHYADTAGLLLDIMTEYAICVCLYLGSLTTQRHQSRAPRWIKSDVALFSRIDPFGTQDFHESQATDTWKNGRCTHAQVDMVGRSICPAKIFGCMVSWQLQEHLGGYIVKHPLRLQAGCMRLWLPWVCISVAEYTM